MFDDLVLVLQERTSEYEDRHGQNKTKSEVCQEKKLHLYAELLFPISLYSSPYPCTLPHIPVLFPISLYSSPYPCKQIPQSWRQNSCQGKWPCSHCCGSRPHA